MSSVFGLNASPQTAKRAPAQVAAERLADLLDQPLLLPLVHRLDGLEHAERRARTRCAVRTSAFTSFGKHEPP